MNNPSLQDQIPPTTYLGIDIAKDSFHFHLNDQLQGFLPNSPIGFRRLLKKIGNQPVQLICEATGGYEQPLVAFFSQRDIAISIVDPARVHYFIKGKGQRAKTDRIDAAMLARFGQENQPEPVVPRTDEQAQLRELTRRRDQLLEVRQTLSNQSRGLGLKALIQANRRLLGLLDRQIAQTENLMSELIERTPEFKARSSQLQKEPGVGPTVAQALLAEMPELGSLNRSSAAALAGVAPYARDSGQRNGKRFIAGGRPQIRSKLYMAALVASRCHPRLKEIYEHLLKRGKPKKVALVALMRHLIIRLNHNLKNAPITS